MRMSTLKSCSAGSSGSSSSTVKTMRSWPRRQTVRTVLERRMLSRRVTTIIKPVGTVLIFSDRHHAAAAGEKIESSRDRPALPTASRAERADRRQRPPTASTPSRRMKPFTSMPFGSPLLGMSTWRSRRHHRGRSRPSSSFTDTPTVRCTSTATSMVCRDTSRRCTASTCWGGDCRPGRNSSRGTIASRRPRTSSSRGWRRGGRPTALIP
mmetsp:Transcript_35935/g.72976  ORF Transcript_35935/g.72976 Transcript_35935/m.72976 type:complete len:210 (-) Transcript_35935:2411-3040(-)